MKFVSLFSGAGMIDRGLELAGLECALQVEIDPECQALLRRHFPGVPRMADVHDVRGSDCGAVGLVCGGSPCQGLSVAGRREGLADDRSRLFHELIRVADESAAPWILWENVAGCLSTPQGSPGEDFACVLEEVTGFRPEVPKDGWRNSGVCIGPRRACAWRVLDSQFVGGCPLHVEERGIGPVPQRRRRVFLVAVARDARGLAGAPPGGDGSSLLALPAEVLFEPEGEGRHPETRGSAEAETAATPGNRPARRGVSQPGRVGEDDSGPIVFDKYNQADTGDVACTLGAGSRQHNNAHVPHVATYHGNGAGSYREGRPTIAAGDDNGCNHLVVAPVPGQSAFIVNAAESCAKETHARESDVARSLDTTGGFAANQGGTVVTAFHCTQDPISGSVAPAMGTGNKQGCGTVGVAYENRQPRRKDVTGWTVRRLTPIETERLMALPDEWTAWGLDADGNRVNLSDSARYRIVGNGAVVLVIEWLGRRILEVARRAGLLARVTP